MAIYIYIYMGIYTYIYELTYRIRGWQERLEQHFEHDRKCWYLVDETPRLRPLTKQLLQRHVGLWSRKIKFKGGAKVVRCAFTENGNSISISIIWSISEQVTVDTSPHSKLSYKPLIVPLVGCWNFTSWQHLRSCQDMYRLMTAPTHSDFIVLPDW